AAPSGRVQGVPGPQAAGQGRANRHEGTSRDSSITRRGGFAEPVGDDDYRERDSEERVGDQAEPGQKSDEASCLEAAVTVISHARILLGTDDRDLIELCWISDIQRD